MDKTNKDRLKYSPAVKCTQGIETPEGIPDLKKGMIFLYDLGSDTMQAPAMGKKTMQYIVYKREHYPELSLDMVKEAPNFFDFCTDEDLSYLSKAVVWLHTLNRPMDQGKGIVETHYPTKE